MAESASDARGGRRKWTGPSTPYYIGVRPCAAVMKLVLQGLVSARLVPTRGRRAFTLSPHSSLRGHHHLSDGRERYRPEQSGLQEGGVFVVEAPGREGVAAGAGTR